MRDIPLSRTPSAVRKLYQWYSFNPFDDRAGCWYNSPLEWERLTQAVIDRFTTSLNAVRTDDALYQQEMEFASHLTVCWRDKGIGTLVQHEDINVRNKQQAVALTPYLKQLAGRMINWAKHQDVNELRTQAYSAAIPMNRGKGAPLWIPSSDPLGGVYLAAVTSNATTVSEMDTELLSTGDWSYGMCITLYLRIQSSKSEVPRTVFDGQSLVVTGKRHGPKTRAVQALPFTYNLRCAPIAELCRSSLVGTLPQASGDFSYVASQRGKYTTAVALDLSKYDTTVSYELNLAVNEHLLTPFVMALTKLGVLDLHDALMGLQIDIANQTLNMLGPPGIIGLGSRLASTHGQIKSGERLTSWRGTVINHCRGLEKMKAHGVTGLYCNSGDDTILLTNGTLSSLEPYLADSSRLGFNETTSPDVTFLMKRVPFGYSYLGRMLIGTINKEASHEPRSELIAAAGLGMRYRLLQGHPLQEQYYKILRGLNSRLDRAINIAESTDPDRILQKIVPAVIAKGKRGDIEAISDLVKLQTDNYRLAPETITILTGLLKQTALPYTDLIKSGQSMGRPAAKRMLRLRRRK